MAHGRLQCLGLSYHRRWLLDRVFKLQETRDLAVRWATEPVVFQFLSRFDGLGGPSYEFEDTLSAILCLQTQFRQRRLICTRDVFCEQAHFRS